MNIKHSKYVEAERQLVTVMGVQDAEFWEEQDKIFSRSLTKVFPRYARHSHDAFDLMVEYGISMNIGPLLIEASWNTNTYHGTESEYFSDHKTRSGAIRMAIVRAATEVIRAQSLPPQQAEEAVQPETNGNSLPRRLRSVGISALCGGVIGVIPPHFYLSALEEALIGAAAGVIAGVIVEFVILPVKVKRQ